MYFIIGASGSGKTASLQGVQARLPGYQCFDFDDIGVPENADKAWRQESTAKWIDRALSEDPDKFVLFGQMVPGEIVACLNSDQLASIRIILLDVADLMRIKRLTGRGTYGLTQDTLNWAAWLRMHCAMPAWETHVMTEGASSLLDFSRVPAQESWPDRLDIRSLDTTDLSIDGVCAQLADMITRQQWP